MVFRAWRRSSGRGSASVTVCRPARISMMRGRGGRAQQRRPTAAAESVVLRTREEVAALFGDLDLIEPGVVQLPQWHPEPDVASSGPLPMWCGVARKTIARF